MKRIFSLIILTVLLVSCFLIIGCKPETKINFAGTYEVFLIPGKYVYASDSMILELKDDGKFSFKHTRNDANGETVLSKGSGCWCQDDASSDTEVYCYYQSENLNSTGNAFSLKYAGDDVLVWFDFNGTIKYYLQRI